ncbi:A-kinase anchor protein 1, mitochondrial isoform X2 [Spea bombifrons]|nr:A-kinase anchor protein 1, mitochondrial isoform X2 [Spea bombifrons]
MASPSSVVSSRIRTILPVIVPAATLAIGCWWWYSRKKKQNKQTSELASPADHVQADCAPLESISGPQLAQQRVTYQHGKSNVLDDLYAVRDDLYAVHQTDLCVSDLNNSWDSAGNEPKTTDVKCNNLQVPLCHLLVNSEEDVGLLIDQSEDLEGRLIKTIDSVVHSPPDNPLVVGGTDQDSPDIITVIDNQPADPEICAIEELFHSEVPELHPQTELPESPATEGPEPCAELLQIAESAYMKSSSVRDDKCDDFFVAFSQCLDKREESAMLSNSVDEGNTRPIFGDYEARIVEQLAIDIISKVIVAAKQEILDHSLCQPVDVELAYVMDQECVLEQGQEHGVHQNVICSNEESDSFSSNSACEFTQTEHHQTDDLIVEKESKTSGVEQFSEDILEEAVHGIQMEQNISPVNRNTDSFESRPVRRYTDSFDEGQTAIDDSSMSACTSEDGICMDEQLQSTVLSSLGIGSPDSLSTSGIDVSRDQISVRRKKKKKARAANRKNLALTNGHAEDTSLDIKGEVTSTSETEVDHSVGSEVNSMDSTDNGCVMEKTEHTENNKPQTDQKNVQLVVWEIEVPKHLVGRLIGKQGRFVSYLKATSGAKIYITTLPFTQEFQLCHIEGSPEEVDVALSIIGNKFKDLDLRNYYQPSLLQRPVTLPATSWLVLPEGVTVDVLVSNVSSPNHLFIQQHTHPTFHALSTLHQQMYLCYSEPGIPNLPMPVEVGTLCAAPNEQSEWSRAHVVAYYPDTEEVAIRYVDYGGYKKVKIETLRQIRSDFVMLPFQGTEVFLDNVVPIDGDNNDEAVAAVARILTGAAFYAQVTGFDFATGIQKIQLWGMLGEEVVSINNFIVESGYACWQHNY